MKSLDSFNHESLAILDNNDLLQPLIKSILIKSTIDKVYIDEKLKTATIQNFKEKNGLNTPAKCNQWLSDRSISNNDLECLALSKIRLQNYCREHFDHKVEPRFLEMKNSLDKVVYSLIRIKSFHKAREIYLRLSSGEEEFGSLAAKFSEGLESKTRGIIGPSPVNAAHPKLIAVLMNGKTGEIQAPMEIAGMHVIVRVESYESAKLDNLMREQIGEELFHQWIDEQSIELKNELLTQRIDSSGVYQ